MPKAKTFEESITELEQIVTLLESGDAPLDEAVALFEKGMKLSAKCHDQLDKAEQKVKLLTENEEGVVKTTDFNSGEDS
ncbi:MAG TPA: exodeoxyribonuclease VII small subunit [Clostridiales bacterium]|jgi:exodeoxyribonuclease VII small subunit|nr:exodeoxyribonuclease VII small subunit [Clostridiales bacterium]MBD8946262.1 exodeoxyribonuclease VII small subunit [Clostridiales bacterium]HBL82318.1 exodeoxyribonuclease VII small subunit [Clostridiales bacterium]